MAKKKKPARTNHTRKTRTPSTAVVHADRRIPVVGIGASAGGLEAIEKFFSRFPSNLNIAFVVIQHLAPEYKSIMGSLLKKFTAMRVAEAQNGALIEPGSIYLNPPDKDVSILNGRLVLSDPVQPRGVRLPIDHFFKSMAESLGEKAICVILSGTGTDGTMGMKAIKGAGGLAMVQIESQARYDNMPRSAIDTGLVDFILPVEKMAGELLKYVKHPYVGSSKEPLIAADKYDHTLQKIFHIIRTTTGHDFSQYKMNSIKRRIERRMAVHQIDELPMYLTLLQNNPLEVKTLFKDFLITVTNFFRDTKAFDVLTQKVVNPIVKSKANEAEVRVWVPGCATGEEAYSIAILFAEAIKAAKKHLNVQIFATDIDPDAIDYARRGAFPDSIVADVSNERLKNYFIQEDHSFRVKKAIRESLIFAVQDLVKDSPFSKLDLISCRNVLIYMNSALQKKVLPLFHYTLNPSGFMFLGTSESIGEYAEMFSTVDSKWKVFKCKAAGPVKMPDHPMLPLGIPAEPEKGRGKLPSMGANIRQLAEKTILREYGPPSVLIDDKFDVQYFHGDTGRFFVMPEGESTFNVLKLCREDLRFKVTSLIHRCMKEKKPVNAKNIRVMGDDSTSIMVNLIVKPIASDVIRSEFYMIMFETVPPAAAKGVKKKETMKKSSDPRVAVLEQELQSTKEYLQTTIEQLATSNEELKSTNEELQSTNEELQSTNEELETSREELQSTNEELETVNTELQNKVEQLSEVNSDLNNLLGCTDIATLFLDNEIHVKRFTPKTTEIFKLIQSDVGRPISDIVHNLQYDELTGDVQEVLRNLGRIEKEIRTRNHNWYFMRIVPYRTIENTIDGVVLTFIDITKQKKAENALRQARDGGESLLAISDDALVLVEAESGLIAECNRHFENLVGRTASELTSMRLWDLFPEELKESGGAHLLETSASGGGVIRDIVVRHSSGARVEIDAALSAVMIREKRYVQLVVRQSKKEIRN